MELYREMMNNGFLIYEKNAKFVVYKMPTENDTRYFGEMEVYNSFETAMNEIKKMILWKEKKDNKPVAASVQTATTTWKMEMMYHHKGLGTKFADLGELGTTSYENANIEAKKRAQSYIDQSGLEKSIDGFEVRVRPCVSR